MPFALEAYKKTPIDYAKFKPGVRELHKQEIVSYLKDDCSDLYTLCVRFREEFGDVLTIGSASMRELKKFHKFKSGNQEYDSRLRSFFYFGGRNQVFRSGIIKAPIRIYDVNSMYPWVMSTALHPVSTGIHIGRAIDSRTAFLCVEGRNFGAFPVRNQDGGLDFTRDDGEFYCSIHEFEAAEETGTFKPAKIKKTFGFSERHTFSDFVTHFYDARRKVKEQGDKILTLFYKFVLNSAYGKFAQNPENYAQYFITEIGEIPEAWHECTKACPVPCRALWTPSFMCNEFIIWKRPTQELNFYNVATGASITAAARAHLLRGLSHASRPFYCDTDSIICSDLRDVYIDDLALGAWKLEVQGNLAAICGKKLYAVYHTNEGRIVDPDAECVKKAHKGARLSGSEIYRIAQGETIENFNPVPAFKFDGSWTFTHRALKSTA